jgi:probable glucitol transport protein GutA
MTHNMAERDSIISYTKMFSLVGILIAMVGGPLLVQSLASNWFLVASLLSILAMVCMLMVFFVKERVKTDLPVPTIGEIARTIFGNKYLVVIILTLILFMGTNFATTITPFIANDVFHDPSLTGAMLGLFVLPMVLLAPFTPWLIRKVGKNFLMYTSLISTVVGSVIVWAAGPSNVPLFLILSFVKSLLGGFFIIISTMYFADCVEYDFRTKGRRFEAATFAAQTFSTKILTAVSGAGGMWLLAAYGFQSAKVGETVVQTPATAAGMWNVYNLGPAVGAVLALLVFWKFYDLNEKKLAQLGD